MPTQPIKFPMRHPPYMVEEKTFRRSAHRSRLLRRSGNSRVFRRLVRQIKGRLLS
jgi:hypothetical protein